MPGKEENEDGGAMFFPFYFIFGSARSSLRLGSLAAANGGCCWLRCSGFSLWWAFVVEVDRYEITESKSIADRTDSTR